uniref:4Fe-4S cluster binding protein n=1 Tax=Paulinella micropora TaxID=1928728 RepID=A0A385I095_9EUKA|nr:4Fe-4S cluster binding protein [Paulinella micropora]AXY63347.1 4Fe-4S cluster binding protein [Paulinella micropora]
MNERLGLQLKNRAREENFELVGITHVIPQTRLSLRSAASEAWLANGHHGNMNWMQDPYRQTIEKLLPGTQSILAVGLQYYVGIQRNPEKLAIARYGWGQDYHKIIDQRLRRVGRWLQEQRPDTHWRTCVDTAPLLDKVWAEQAGLGWIGKNSNLINSQKGSWFVIGHLLTDILFPSDEPAESLCGSCRRCLEACPTGALTEPFVVDSRRCIAFHTIENRNSHLPEIIKKHMGSWIIGCDICQDVCPWNHNPLTFSNNLQLYPKSWVLNLTTQDIRTWKDELWHQRLHGSALRRIKPWMWRRNTGHHI